MPRGRPLQKKKKKEVRKELKRAQKKVVREYYLTKSSRQNIWVVLRQCKRINKGQIHGVREAVNPRVSSTRNQSSLALDHRPPFPVETFSYPMGRSPLYPCCRTVFLFFSSSFSLCVFVAVNENEVKNFLNRRASDYPITTLKSAESAAIPHWEQPEAKTSSELQSTSATEARLRTTSVKHQR